VNEAALVLWYVTIHALPPQLRTNAFFRAPQNLVVNLANADLPPTQKPPEFSLTTAAPASTSHAASTFITRHCVAQPSRRQHQLQQ